MRNVFPHAVEFSQEVLRVGAAGVVWTLPRMGTMQENRYRAPHTRAARAVAGQTDMAAIGVVFIKDLPDELHHGIGGVFPAAPEDAGYRVGVSHGQRNVEKELSAALADSVRISRAVGTSGRAVQLDFHIRKFLRTSESRFDFVLPGRKTYQILAT